MPPRKDFARLLDEMDTPIRQESERQMITTTEAIRQNWAAQHPEVCADKIVALMDQLADARVPKMTCLFCTFTGTRDELIAHSAGCESHPLWKALESIASAYEIQKALLECAGITVQPTDGEL